MPGSNFPTPNNNPNRSPLGTSSNNLIAIQRTDSTHPHLPLSEAQRREILQIPGTNIILFNCGEVRPSHNGLNISQVPSLAHAGPSQTNGDPRAQDRQFNLFDNLRRNNPREE